MGRQAPTPSCSTLDLVPHPAKNMPPLPSPPKGNIFTRSTVYPFILFTALTSLALNLAQSRSNHTQARDSLLAQISVLESIIARVDPPRGDNDKGKGKIRARLSENELEAIERELELVQLGRAKGRQALNGIGNVERGGREGIKEVIGWGEVLFGKKGDEFQPEKDDTDWEKGTSLRWFHALCQSKIADVQSTTVFQDADAKERLRNMPGYQPEQALALVPALPSTNPPKEFIAPEEAQEELPKKPRSALYL